MKRVSSILLAASLIGGVAHAAEYTEVQAVLTFESALLSTPVGAATVLADLESQARTYCRTASALTTGVRVDQVCASDLLVQAVEEIGNSNLTAEYAKSEYYVETVSSRVQLASN